jgi:hypothetical protein
MSDMAEVLRGPLTPPARLLLILALLAIYLLAALYPFAWDPPVNAATWQPQGGLSFPGAGLARTVDAPDWMSAALRSQRLAIHLRVRPALSQQWGPARIMTLSHDTQARNFTVAQSGDDLSLRLRTPATGPNGLPEVRVPDVFSAGEWVNLGIFIEPRALRIVIDGDRRLRRSLPAAPLARWDPDYPLALGNELTTGRPWLGEIARATISAGRQTVSYLRPAMLTTPPIFWLVEPRPALVPFVDLVPRDTIVNILGFIPLGLLLSAGAGPRGRRFPWWSLLFIAGVSLGLELLQLGFVGRTTSINDLICNTLGGALGLVLGRRFLQAT